jgi:predicted amidophosphoribosyltransferase
MKFSQFWKKQEDRTVEVHYCKQCGAELASTNKDELCDNCRRTTASNLRTALGAVGGLLLLAIGILIKRK